MPSDDKPGQAGKGVDLYTGLPYPITPMQHHAEAAYAVAEAIHRGEQRCAVVRWSHILWQPLHPP